MYMARRPISLLLCTNGLRKRSSRADQGLSLGPEAAMLPGPRVETHPPPLSAGAEPKSQGHCWKWHNKLKVV